MTATTLTTARGSKVRTASNRRFVLVTERVVAQTDEVKDARIEKRSDKTEVLRAHVQRVARNSRGAAEFTVFTVFDTNTKEIVQ